MQSLQQSRRVRRAAGPLVSPAVLLAVSLLAGGCAMTEAGPSRVAGPATPASAPVVAYPGDPPPREPAVQSIRIEVEDDGLPSQLAPRHRAAVKDEPAEPWSPNYGAVRAPAFDTAQLAAKLDEATAGAKPAPAAAIAAAQKAPMDADDIIRRAIAEHEMRRR